jgi:hypothetical protein
MICQVNLTVGIVWKQMDVPTGIVKVPQMTQARVSKRIAGLGRGITECNMEK